MTDTTLTKAENAWIAKALRQRQQTVQVMWAKIIASHVLLYFILPVGLWYVVVFKALLTKPQISSNDLMGVALVTVIALAPMIVGYLSYRRYPDTIKTALEQVKKAQLVTPVDIVSRAAQIVFWEGSGWRAYAHFDYEALPDDGVTLGTTIQIPHHWKRRLKQRPFLIRAVKVDAQLGHLTIKTTRGINTFIDGAPWIPATSTPLPNPQLILLSAGPYSVTAEAEDGFGLPRFDSFAWWELCGYPAVLGAILLGIGFSASTSQSPTALIYTGIGGVLCLPLTIKLLRWIALHIRLMIYDRRKRKGHCDGS